MKNPGSLEDDFWSCFIFLWIVGFSCILNFVRTIQPHLHSLFDYVCLDVDHSSDKLFGPNKSTQVEPLMCFLLHFVLSLRIHMFKNQKVNSIQLGTQRGSATNQFYRRNEKISLADFLINFLLVMWIGSLAYFQFKISQMSVNEVNTYPYGLYLFLFQYYANSFSALTIPLVLFCRNPHFKKNILKEISEFF
jgi:hypothetical protein